MAAYRLAAAAQEDLRRIYVYGCKHWGEDAAERYYHALFDRFEQLAAQPYLYPAVDHIRPGYRRSVCGVDSIYYRVKDEVVEIMAIVGTQDTEHLP